MRTCRKILKEKNKKKLGRGLLQNNLDSYDIYFLLLYFFCFSKLVLKGAFLIYSRS